jgi:hypothetical protein
MGGCGENWLAGRLRNAFNPAAMQHTIRLGQPRRPKLFDLLIS